MAYMPKDSTVSHFKTLARISYVIPRISCRLPWRSDCIIQSITGQNWLNSLGLGSEIHIGVQRGSRVEFAAHAWLLHEGYIVTGDDVSGYTVLLRGVVCDDNADTITR